MTNTIFKSTHLISEVTQTELAENEDQLIDTELFDSGVLSMRFAAKDGTLRSRICLALGHCKAVEAFSDNVESKFFQIRADGAQVPVLLTVEECDVFMTLVDGILSKNK